MHIKNLSFSTQIFLALTMLVTLPTLILGIYTSNSTVEQVNSQYQQMLDTILSQTNLNLDTLLSDMEKLGNMHLVNDEMRRALVTDYTDDIGRYALDSTMMRDHFLQSNRLNSNVIHSIFQNKYGFTFEYNFVTDRDLQDTITNMRTWTELARAGERYTYFAPIQFPKESGIYKKNILPMVQILRDRYSDEEIGVFYVGINFDAAADILKSSSLSGSKMAFFSRDNDLLFSTDPDFTADPAHAEHIRQLENASSQVDKASPGISENVTIDGVDYTINAVYNKTTSWKIVGLMDNSVITGAYRQNFRKYMGIFALNIVCGLALAFLLSQGLTRSISRICREIDSCESGDLGSIGLRRAPSNRELRKVTDSYNRLNKRLTESLAQNYEVKLREKQARLRMLQLQINPHFFYNTLNLISAIANIHDIGEIKTITGSMSDILRYNLKTGPIVQLRDEVHLVQQYLAIYDIRFPGKFRFDLSIPPELLDIQVPAFILQPIVENSIGHGLEEREADADISIHAYCEKNTLHLLILDNGAGIPPDILSGIRGALGSDLLQGSPVAEKDSIGILNVHQRIRAYYGPEYGLGIDSTLGAGTTVSLRLHLDQPPRLPGDVGIYREPA